LTQTHLTHQLRELDEHIKAARTQIAHLQVEIANMENARLTLMRIEERKAYFAGQPSPFGDFNGARIAVRDPELRMLEEGIMSRAAKTGAALPALAEAAGLEPSAWQLRQHPPGKKKRKPRAGGSTRVRLLELLKDEPEGMTSAEICGFLGIPAKDEDRKPVQNALYNMKLSGLLDIKLTPPAPGHRKDAKTYFITQLGLEAAVKAAAR
jgi:hypothetical protein